MFNSSAFNVKQFNEITAGAAEVPLSSLMLYTFAPQILVAVNVDVPFLTLTLTAYAPTVFGYIEVPALTLTLTTFIPRCGEIYKHAAVKGIYTGTSRRINRVYVVGMDSDGNYVYAEAKNQTDIDLYGEFLRFYVDTTCTTAADAQIVADNILAKVRLETIRGGALIPPNLGQQLWDVIDVTDTVCKQVNAKYRVSGWRLTYNNEAGRFNQALSFTEV